MSMPTITVIIENGLPTTEEQYEEQEVEISCPTATQDETLNEANKEAAIQDHSYGPTDISDKRCGNCGYFNMTKAMLDCIGDTEEDVVSEASHGYCQLFHFNCLAKNVCDSWMKGGPITDHIEEPQDDETMLGKRFI
tara:strand:+ start:861 stop:1271 length:411 start_codon:yes stop_codon:yes gene_type:complete